MSERDETLVDLLAVPAWLTRPLFEDDHRLGWKQLQSHPAGRRVFMLDGVDEDEDDPAGELRQAIAELQAEYVQSMLNIDSATCCALERALRPVVEKAGLKW